MLQTEAPMIMYFIAEYFAWCYCESMDLPQERFQPAEHNFMNHAWALSDRMHEILKEEARMLGGDELAAKIDSERDVDSLFPNPESVRTLLEINPDAFKNVLGSFEAKGLAERHEAQNARSERLAALQADHKFTVRRFGRTVLDGLGDAFSIYPPRRPRR